MTALMTLSGLQHVSDSFLERDWASQWETTGTRSAVHGCVPQKSRGCFIIPGGVEPRLDGSDGFCPPRCLLQATSWRQPVTVDPGLCSPCQCVTKRLPERRKRASVWFSSLTRKCWFCLWRHFQPDSWLQM